MSTENNDKRDARAELAAAKARAKAERSWPARHKVLTGLGGLVVVAVVASVAGGGGGGDATQSASSDTKQSARQPEVKAPAKAASEPTAKAGIGDKVRDGQFEFTVKKVSCGKTSIGDQYLSTKAQGEFCLVSMTVKNIGDSAQMLDGSSQEAFSSDGKKFSSDTEASIYMGDQGQVFLNEINPGNSVKGTVVYDVPKGTKLTQVELHDSMFSGGVKVTLK